MKAPKITPMPDLFDGALLLRTREVAERMGVSRRAVLTYAARGLIPSVLTPGGQRRYPADAITAWWDKDGEGR